MGVVFMAGNVLAQSDPMGAADTVTLVITELEKGRWMIAAHVFNDEELAAIDIPLKYTAGIAKVKLDSMTYDQGRIGFFAYKFDQKDSLSQTVRFGGLAYLNPNNPALEAGSGEVGRAYLSVQGGKEPGPFAADTITLPPNAVLMLVDKGATSIIPVLKISTIKPEKATKNEGKK